MRDQNTLKMKKINEKGAFLAIFQIIIVTAVFWPKLATLELFSPLAVKSASYDFDIAITGKKDDASVSADYFNVSSWYRESNEIEKAEEDLRTINEDEYFDAVASWYGPGFHGRKMANGQIFDMYNEELIAHKTLAFGTKVEIINPQNNNTLIATVKDRGPYIKGRDFDLSYAGAEKLGVADKGVAKLKVRIIE